MGKRPLAGGDDPRSRGLCRFKGQKPPDRFQEGRKIKRIGHKFAAEGPLIAPRIPFLKGYSQHQKGDFSRRDVPFQDSDDFKAGFMKVHEDQIRLTLEGCSQSGFARLGNQERITVVEKKVSDHFECLWFIYRNQDEFIHLTYLFHSPGGAWISTALIQL
jgi:hypothetical protein